MHSRFRARARAVTLLAGPALLATLTLTGCGSDEPSKDSGSAATKAESPSDGDAQVIEVKDYGLSYELPTGWTSLDGKDFVTDDYPRDIAEELAGRLGISTDQLIEMMSSSVLTLSMSDAPPQDGFTDNVNTVTQYPDINDEQIRSSLVALGAKAGEVEHSTTAVGELARVAYELPTRDNTVQGVSMTVAAGDDTVTITVSSASAERAEEIADQIEESLVPLAD